MNIDELLKLPMVEPRIGGAETALHVLDVKEAKNQPIYNRIVLVDRTVESAKQKIAGVQNLESSGMKKENVLAISGLATLDILKNPALQTDLINYLYLLPMGYSYTSLDQLVTVQLLFIIVFQQMYYMLMLTDKKDVPRFSESFEKRYTKVRELVSKELSSKEIFSVPAELLRGDFWKTVNDSLGVSHEYSFQDILNFIIEKDPAELNAHFDSMSKPAILQESHNNSLSSAHNNTQSVKVPVTKPDVVIPNGVSVHTGDPNNAASTTASANNNQSNTSSITAVSDNNNNIQPVLEQNPFVDAEIVRITKSYLLQNTGLYEKFIAKNKVPVAVHFKHVYDTLKLFEKTNKASYDFGIREYLSLTRDRPPTGASRRSTLKNHKKINYTF
jgi:hypothetical protein